MVKRERAVRDEGGGFAVGLAADEEDGRAAGAHQRSLFICNLPRLANLEVVTMQDFLGGVCIQAQVVHLVAELCRQAKEVEDILDLLPLEPGQAATLATQVDESISRCVTLNGGLVESVLEGSIGIKCEVP